MSARELWRPRSRRTRRSRSSIWKVRGYVLGGGGLNSDRVSLCWAVLLKASGPLAGRVAPPLVGVTLAVWVACCARRRQWHRRRRRESSGGVAREEHDAQGARPLRCAALCSRWLWERGMCGAVPRPAAARGRARCRASSRVQLGGARAASGPLAGRVAPLSCRGDVCRVGWVLCTPQGMASATTARELWRPRSRRTRRSRRSTSEVRGSVLAVAGKGGMCGAVPRPAAARGRTMQSELARAAGRRACGVGSPCRARGSSLLSG